MKLSGRFQSSVFLSALLLVAAGIGACNSGKSAASNGVPRTPDGHPDFNGYWGRLKIDAPPQTEPLDHIEGVVGGYSEYIVALEKDNQVNMRRQSNRPIYKPEFWEKIRAVDWDY